MTLQETLEDLLEQVYEDPTNRELRGIAADAALDCGDDLLAECLQWMVRNGVSTFYSEVDNDWSWFDTDCTPFTNSKHSRIPQVVYTTLKGSKNGNDHIFKEYPTNKKAEQALFAAWKEAKQSGWTPEE
jgi:hypothetical protein